MVQFPVMFCLAFSLLHSLLTAATVAEVSSWPDEAFQKAWVADLSGTVTVVTADRFVLEDKTGRTRFFHWRGDLQSGDVVKLRCIGVIDDAKRNILLARNLKKTGKAEAKQPEETSIARIVRGEHDLMAVRVRGVVVDSTPDEIDPGNSFLLLGDGKDTVDVPIKRSQHPEKLIGAEIEVTGVCEPEIGSWRLFQGRGMETIPGFDYIKVLTPPPEDPFSAPPLGTEANISANNLAAIGRRSATGRVLAVWHGDSMLLSAAKRGRWNRLQATLAKGQALPRCGDVVQVVGFPRTDLFTITLDNALCQPSRTDSVPASADSEPVDVTARELMTDMAGLSKLQAPYHGRTIRIRGKVRSVPSEDLNENRIQMQSGEYIIPIDVSSCPEAAQLVASDYEIEVVGVCLLLAETWRPNSRMPHAKGFAVIVRDAGDIKVLSRPSWWTPERLVFVIFALLMSVVGVFVWNWLLRRLVARRSRELLKSQVAKAESDLRVGERTRLAAELHDAISQTLTGVSFQIDAAADTLGSDLPTAARFIAVARQTLLSCREELRRCLWDLRNDSLEGSDYAETLRRAIRPGIGAAKLTVRFDARRSKMSDSTAHAVLCIVRELCVNAVRHGGARSIQVAGAVESRSIRLSVRDDGRGFDPSKCPGPAEGHFGLQGIRERVARLGGRMTIESSEGKGASVIIEVRNETDKHTAG